MPNSQSRNSRRGNAKAAQRKSQTLETVGLIIVLILILAITITRTWHHISWSAR